MAIVQVDGLSYSYPSGQPALVDVSLSIAPLEPVALVGPNGAGKSTLLLHLNGVLPEAADKAKHKGCVRIDGREVCRANLAQVRRDVGLMFQNPDDQLFCPTLIEDVAFGPLNFGVAASEARKVALEALEQVGLAGKGDRVPHQLSVGERKRACLAGVLACRPRVLALDEPTGYLDPRGRRTFIQLLRSIDVAKLIATHDLEMVLELCPRVILLDEGRIVADGPSAVILNDAELLEEHGLERPISLSLGVPPRTASSG